MNIDARRVAMFAWISGYVNRNVMEMHDRVQVFERNGLSGAAGGLSPPTVDNGLVRKLPVAARLRQTRDL